MYNVSLICVAGHYSYHLFSVVLKQECLNLKIHSGRFHFHTPTMSRFPDLPITYPSLRPQSHLTLSVIRVHKHESVLNRENNSSLKAVVHTNLWSTPSCLRVPSNLTHTHSLLTFFVIYAPVMEVSSQGKCFFVLFLIIVGSILDAQKGRRINSHNCDHGGFAKMTPPLFNSRARAFFCCKANPTNHTRSRKLQAAVLL